MASSMRQCSINRHSSTRAFKSVRPRHHQLRAVHITNGPHAQEETTVDLAAFAPRLKAISVATLAAVSLMAAPVQAMDLESTTTTFNMKCAGCHQNGGNILAVGATLFPQDLARNGVAEPDALYDLIYKGKGKMPGFGQNCAPKGQCTFGKRLTDEEIKDLATYVLQKAEAGWK